MVVQTGNLIMRIITGAYNRSHHCYKAISSGLVGATETEKVAVAVENLGS